MLELVCSAAPKRSGTQALTLVLLLWLPVSPGAAATAIYTNETDFIAAAAQQPASLNEFADIGYLGQLAHPVQSNTNGISYYVTSQPNLHVVAFNGGLSTVETNDQLVATFTSANVAGVGGKFFAADANGTVLPGTVTVTVSDGTVAAATSSAGTPAPFLGFLTTGPLLTSLTLSNSSATGLPAMAHFYAVAGVPVPSIARGQNGSLLISWFGAPTGYVLQAAAQFPGGTWTNVPLTPQVVSNQVQVLLPSSGAAGFFRLLKP